MLQKWHAPKNKSQLTTIWHRHHTLICVLTKKQKVQLWIWSMGGSSSWPISHICYGKLTAGLRKCDIPSLRSLETLVNLENPSKMAFFDHYFCSPVQNTASTWKYVSVQLRIDVGHDNLPSRRVSGRDHARPSQKRDDFLGGFRGF